MHVSLVYVVFTTGCYVDRPTRASPTWDSGVL
jgi:hypothetical protein